MPRQPRLAAFFAGLFLLIGAAFANPTLYSDFAGDAAEECAEIGEFAYAYKIEGWDEGNKTGSYTDPVTGETFDITDYWPESLTFDWSATTPIGAVAVKGGRDANVWEYDPPVTSDAGLYAPDGLEVSHVTFCWNEPPYEDLVVSKTASGSYDRTVAWELEKSVTPDSHTGFVGEDAGTSTWTVTATKTEVSDDYEVTGTITIENPNDFAVDFTVQDELEDSTVAAVTCDGTGDETGTVEALSTVECSYVASPDDDFATMNYVDVYVADQDTVTATAPIDWTENLIGDDTVTIDDDRDTEGQFPTDISSTTTFDYDETFTCSSDPKAYTDGVDADDYPNTATLTGEDTDLTADADVDVICYAPLVTKTADTSYTREYSWTITKDDDGEYDKFIGDPATTHDYEVSVEQTITDKDFAVNGTITVTNPNPNAAMTVDLSDTVDGVEANLDCSGTLDVPAGGSATCDYDADLDAKTDGTNTATATLNGIDFDATADYAFGEPTDTVGFSSINVTDTNGESWTASGDDSWTYTRDFECSTDINDYEGGTYSFDHDNTATIDETDQSDDATVTVNCYAPLVSKTADTSYARTHDWSIAKTVATVNDLTHDGYAKIWLYVDGTGDETATWTVDVTYEGFQDSDFAVNGTITVTNPNPATAMTVDLSDTVDGVEATLECGGTLDVPAGGSATCDYDADLDTKTDGTNTATATLNGIDFDATADYAFGEPTTETLDTVTITDDNPGFSGPVTLDAADYMPGDTETFTYHQAFTWSEYGADDCGDFVYENTATIVETTQSATATLKVNVQCYVYETAYAMGDDAECFIPDFSQWGWTNPIDPGTYTWELWAGAAQCDTDNGTLVGSVTVDYDGDGYVIVEYDVDAEYSLEETHVYAGYDMYPQRGRRSTVAPGQYDNDGPFDGSEVYVIAHAVVGLPDPDFGP